MKRALLPIAMTAILGFSSQASAIEMDGFLTAGFAIHDQEDSKYLDTITDDIRFDNDSKFGLQVTADVADNMQVVSQILAAGSDENFDLDVEWAYLDWVINDTYSLRGGKVKEPVFLISDYIEVGYAYPWIRPPQEVYRNNPINTINGFEALVQLDVGGMGLTIQPYLGSNSEAVPNQPGLIFDAENFFGASIQLASRNFTVQVSFLDTDVAVSGATGVVETTSTTGFGNPVPFSSEGTATLTSVGVSTDVSNFVAYAEYVTRDIENTTLAGASAPMDALFPDQDAWYVTVGYRMGKLLPHLTIANSEAEPLNSPTANPGVSQDSITLGVRYEINDSAALKFEVQSIEPDLEVNSVGLFNALPGDFTAGDKSTLVSVAVDVIF